MTGGTARAAVLQGPRAAAVERAPLPPLGPREVRVRLEGCGVCGSNLPVWEGRPWFKYPLAAGAPGHEGWGRVAEIGAEVERIAVGQRVAALSYQAFAEFDVAEASNVVVLPPELDGQPFPGEALGCAMNVFQRSDIRAWHTVAVVGVGFMGAVLVALAAKAGARVIAISRRPFALEIARRMGATETIALGERAAVVGAVRELTGGGGCERVIEATGLQEPLHLAGELTAERGRLIIAGFHQDGLREVNLQLWNWRGLDVVNAHERDPRAYVAGMRAAADAVARGRLDPRPLYTDQFRLDEIAHALDAMRDRDGAFLKALLTYD
ncbi:MAG: L-iditol 2-dehydrogenase [Opitutus sp.]|nr:L-iditol 2-dehydrogenase [Opitutus sp.]